MAAESTKGLTLHEEVLLLVLKDEKGTLEWVAGNYQHVLAGAMIAELLLEERIRIEDSKKHLGKVLNISSLGDPVLDDVRRN